MAYILSLEIYSPRYINSFQVVFLISKVYSECIEGTPVRSNERITEVLSQSRTLTALQLLSAYDFVQLLAVFSAVDAVIGISSRPYQ